MPADVKEVFRNSEVAKDPKRHNVFLFVLDHQGRPVHGFHGLPAGRGVSEGRSDYTKEIPRALAKLKLPAEKPSGQQEGRPVVLPDLQRTDRGVPTGVRLFVRLHAEGWGSTMPVVEVVAMKAEEWKVLAFPGKTREIQAAALKNWLVQLYPAAIRAADQAKPFTNVTGSLTLEPAGVDKVGRYALLRGKIHLAKGDDNESAFEGTLQAVVTYRSDAAEVKSLRGVVEGDYLYRTRGTHKLPIVAAIESRPE
ncbi:MAG: hypothetical protein HYS12_08010 [Planctomycetes bacterium]|nr:hypothetical protein [Planctomycetota bacterium]